MRKLSKNETGRSMVEMLGVLAIIGVLSIGAVSGYRWAMDKMAANDIVNEIKKRAVVASQQRIQSNALDLSEFQNTIRDSYTVTATDNYQGNIGAFTLSVSNIEQSVCDKVLAQDWYLPVIVALNGTEVSDISTCGETNTFLYVFNNDLDSGAVDGDETTPTCGPNEYVDINTGKCIEDTKCPVGEFFHGTLDDKWNLSTICSPCPTHIGDTVEMLSALEDSCSKCPNAVPVSKDSGNGGHFCLYCPNPRPVCGTTCCAENEVCQPDTSSWPRTYTCVAARCASDADCSGDTPLCDMVTGTCFAGCRDNDDCQDAGSGDWFCDLDVGSTGYSCTQKPGRGTCQPATTGTAGPYTRSTADMNWWSAENFCQAIGKQMADPTTACTAEEWAQIKANGYGYCEALKGIADDNCYWTKRLTNNCHAWRVYLSAGSVGNRIRYNHDDRALCE